MRYTSLHDSIDESFLDDGIELALILSKLYSLMESTGASVVAVSRAMLSVERITTDLNLLEHELLC